MFCSATWYADKYVNLHLLLQLLHISISVSLMKISGLQWGVVCLPNALQKYLSSLKALALSSNSFASKMGLYGLKV